MASFSRQLGSRRLAMILVAVALVGQWRPSAAQGNRWIAAARALGLDSLPGPATTYFSAGARPRAQALRSEVLQALAFFRDSLGAADSTVHIAVIDRHDWPAFAPAEFYGAASNVGPAPWTLLMTATGEGNMADMLGALRPRTSAATWAALDTSGLPIAAVVLREMDMAIVHEYGHAIARNMLGIRWAKEWFQEFLANYLMWSFYSSRYPNRARAYAAWDGVLLEAAPSPPTQLSAYESGISELLSRGDFASAMWFHASVGRRVRTCYARRGLSLIGDLRRLLPASEGWALEDERLLPILDSVCPGFTAWASDMRRPES
jgi:hypothetical protein